MEYKKHLEVIAKAKKSFETECGELPQCVIDKIKKLEDRIAKNHFSIIYNELFENEQKLIKDKKYISDIMSKIIQNITKETTVEVLLERIKLLQKTKGIPKISGLTKEKVNIIISDYNSQFKTNYFEEWLLSTVKVPKNKSKNFRAVFNNDSTESDSESSYI